MLAIIVCHASQVAGLATAVAAFVFLAGLQVHVHSLEEPPNKTKQQTSQQTIN